MSTASSFWPHTGSSRATCEQSARAVPAEAPVSRSPRPVGFRDRWVTGSALEAGPPWARGTQPLRTLQSVSPQPPSHRAPCPAPGGLCKATSPRKALAAPRGARPASLLPGASDTSWSSLLARIDLIFSAKWKAVGNAGLGHPGFLAVNESQPNGKPGEAPARRSDADAGSTGGAEGRRPATGRPPGAAPQGTSQLAPR